MKKEIIIIVGLITLILAGFLAYTILNNQSISNTPSNKSTATSTNKNEVIIQDNLFTPRKITVKVGASISFINKDGVTHTITETKKVFDKEIKPGDVLKVTFSNVGEFDYYCLDHPEMRGRVNVEK